MKRFLVTMVTEIVIEAGCEYDAVITSMDDKLFGLYKPRDKTVKEISFSDDVPKGTLTIQADI